MVSKKRNRMIQKLVNLDEIEVDDEIIISAYSELKYLKVLRLPIKPGSTTFKVSLSRTQRSHGTWQFLINSFEQDCNKHNTIAYQDLKHRHIFLVKRKEN